MTTDSTTISEPDQVSTVEFYPLLCGWLCYCHTGSWSVSQPLWFLIVLQGYAKLIFGHFWNRRWEVALSLFASYLMGRVSIDWKRSLMVALWLCVDTIALVLEILLNGPHATRRAPAKIVTAIMEALLAFGVIAYLGQLTLSLKGQGKWIWLAKLASLGAWSLGWGLLSLLYWLQLTSDLAIMVWLMTYAALFHYSAASPSYLWVTPEARWFHHCLSIAVEYATVTSVFCIEGPGDLPYISMTMSQTLQTRYNVTWTSAFGTAAHTFRIKTQQGGMYLPIISYVWEDPKDRFLLPTLHLLDGMVVAVGTHSSPDSPTPGTDIKGCQVSITTAEGSTQTSVTTKTVTCQTSAGDDEEQHQPASLEELVSQTSATGDSMQEETGPPQLTDGLLAEVMSAIPPQPFSPPLPLPPILSPLHSPVDTISHGRQRTPAADRSPSPPVLQREPVSSPLLMHPDFIDEFEILDVWSPPQVPRSPYYSGFLEDEVLSLCVYDTDLDFL
ncbi:hypothetical protein XENOCAPTIV_018662 [Xenoophorus captivus]|uniref:Transmembrane protein n=1 Tax=Xenoophorus captivus TaxID=1517983 RepID=A0ABV0R9F4_9TELE